MHLAAAPQPCSPAPWVGEHPPAPGERGTLPGEEPLPGLDAVWWLLLALTDGWEMPKSTESRGELLRQKKIKLLLQLTLLLNRGAWELSLFQTYRHNN